MRLIVWALGLKGFGGINQASHGKSFLFSLLGRHLVPQHRCPLGHNNNRTVQSFTWQQIGSAILPVLERWTWPHCRGRAEKLWVHIKSITHYSLPLTAASIPVIEPPRDPLPTLNHAPLTPQQHCQVESCISETFDTMPLVETNSGRCVQQRY